MTNIKTLGEKIAYIRGLYCKYNIQIKEGQGLYCILIEGDKIANGMKPQSCEELKKMAESYHYIWALWDTLLVCDTAGWDIRNHLRQITTGSVNYGTPANPAKGNAEIYYKDFEYELFIGACLIKQGLPAKLPKAPNDPIRDIYVNDVNIQIKHPNSQKKLKKDVSEFNKKLEKDKIYGFFIVGLEDMFLLGDKPYFKSEDDFGIWHFKKKEEIEIFGKEHVVSMVQKKERILGIAQTNTLGVLWIAEGTRLERVGNSLLFSRSSVPITIMETAKKIADTFQNPCLSAMPV